MRKRLLSLACLLLSGLQLFAQPMSDAEILSAIRENPYRSGGCLCPYEGGPYLDTPAPDGYVPFYVSHMGRHGSRRQWCMPEFKSVVKTLDSLHRAALLTPCGESLRLELCHILLDSKGKDGMLTGRGTLEHTQIARNIASRFPDAFTQADRRTATLTSTDVHRTIQSMAGFTSGLVSEFPSLDVRISSGFDRVDFSLPGGPEMTAEQIKDIRRSIEEKMKPSAEELEGLTSRLFTDPAAVEHALAPTGLTDFLLDVFNLSCGAACLDIAVDPLRFFTPEELLSFFRWRDVAFNSQYGTMASMREYRAKSGLRWARLIVDEADAAIEGNGHCADFRFAHDGNIGPLMNLLSIGPFQYTASDDAPYRDWQSFRNICMGSNLQLIFYRGPGEDILVKALYNEREIDFPGLEPVGKVYYKWSDARRYILSRTGGVREVPDYYEKYLKKKAAEIARVQKSEADGFYFWTDTHFPSNFGNSPALIEYLENNSGRRNVISGGDILTYVDDMSEPVAEQIAAFEQVRGAAPLYWVRGNHDCVNYTGRKAWNKAERKALYQWESAELLARFRGPGAVCDPQAPYSSYYYFDNPEAGIRYVILETTDSVADNKVVYGMAERQLRWVAEEAILGAPAGTRFLFLSHVPPVNNDVESINLVAKEIEALASHGLFTLGQMTYDFSKRPDLCVLGVVCGHRHLDSVTHFGDGLCQINVAADCNYKRLDAGGTTDEQCFDYISISKDFQTIRIVRIGAGSDRTVTLH